ncbi:hypothetical protein FNAPI_4323 [Fusarium napiforme]|uniref:Uncharacterized protein n=1 Tax=Fusarium napiforme TaxID=42672 RepID=A0A8H5ND05_9HYPO|nr:hypothetical protein FNAPI_4323 [Fusarium napiforme]
MADDSAESLTLEDLEVAIPHLRNSVESISRHDPDFCSAVILLAPALRKHHPFSRPHGDLSALEDLASASSLCCDATESESDAREASRLVYKAVDTVEKDDPSYPAVPQSACRIIGKKAIRLPDKDDFERLFGMHKCILDITPLNHPKLISRWRSYEDTLFKGYMTFGEGKALEESIRVSQQIVSTTDHDSEEHARHLWILGRRIIQRYLRNGTSGDLDASIKACQQAVDETPISSKNRQRRLQSLYDRLGEKYSQTLDDDDFQRAYDIAKEAVDLTTDSDVGPTVRLSILGVLLLGAYGKTGSKERLEESIRFGREALPATPDGHPDSALRNFNLADRLRIRHLEYGSADDLQDAISYYQKALNHSSASMFLRLQAGFSLMQSYVSNHDLEGGYKAVSKTIDILSLLRSRPLRNADLQHEASKLAGLATQAASIGLHSGKSAVEALEFLEMARGVVASSISVLRADTKELEKELPELAQQYNSLRDQLDDGPSHDAGFELDDEVWANAMTQTYDTGEQLSALLAEIRSNPGLKFFLRPDDEEGMRRAAVLGPLIVANVASALFVASAVYDAMIIHRDGFGTVRLPRLSKSDIDSKYQTLGQRSLKVLERLWDAVAEPILNSLGFTEPPQRAR